VGALQRPGRAATSARAPTRHPSDQLQGRRLPTTFGVLIVRHRVVSLAREAEKLVELRQRGRRWTGPRNSGPDIERSGPLSFRSPKTGGRHRIVQDAGPAELLVTGPYFPRAGRTRRSGNVLDTTTGRRGSETPGSISGHPATSGLAGKASSDDLVAFMASFTATSTGTRSARARAPTRAVQDEPSHRNTQRAFGPRPADVAIAEAPQGAGAT